MSFPTYHAGSWISAEPATEIKHQVWRRNEVKWRRHYIALIQIWHPHTSSWEFPLDICVVLCKVKQNNAAKSLFIWIAFCIFKIDFLEKTLLNWSNNAQCFCFNKMLRGQVGIMCKSINVSTRTRGSLVPRISILPEKWERGWHSRLGLQEKTKSFKF